MNILIVKFGALGDVVRTSYFAKSLKCYQDSHENIKLFWLTAEVSAPLIRFNPYIDRVITDVRLLKDIEFDIIYSLDDEFEILTLIQDLKYDRLVGAYIVDSRQRLYTPDVAEWFDMGLLSVYGKNEADRLKLANCRTHAEIFSKIFNVYKVEPNFFNSSFKHSCMKEFVAVKARGDICVGINPFAGRRWKSKSLPIHVLEGLVEVLLNSSVNKRNFTLFLLGGGDDIKENIRVFKNNKWGNRVFVVDTTDDILDFAALISNLDVLVSTDSLALHLAIGQNIKSVSFFTATSAVEIDSFSTGRKAVSTASDYCSYKSDADNSTITVTLLMQEFMQHFK